jgi:hypothetical protein
MALFEVTPGQRAGAPLARPVELVCFALVVAQAVYLAAAYIQGSWLIAPGGGHDVPADFVNVWAAGQLALSGHAVAAYDWPAHKLMEETAVGHSFDGYYAWPYPPTFLFVAAGLALLPYTAACLAWTFATFLA